MTQTADEEVTTPKKAAPKKAAPKKPTDRKPKGEKAKAVTRPEETPGWELLKPFSEVPVWDQMPLVQLLDNVISDSTRELTKAEYAALTPEERKELKEGKAQSVDLNMFGQLAKSLIEFAVDKEAYTKFCSGSGAMERSMTLAMAWVGQMGEAIGSENS